MVLVQKFARCNTGTAGVSMAGEESAPNACSMEGDIGAGREGAMETLQIVTRGEDLSIPKDDFVAGDVSLVKIVERGQRRGSSNEGQEITDGNDFGGFFMVVAALLDIRGEQMVTTLVPGCRGWLGDGDGTGGTSCWSGRSAASRRSGWTRVG